MIAAGIEYEEVGDGPPVIALHGIGGHADSFFHQLHGLVDHRVIAWNMPGYGRSAARSLSFDMLSEALSEFMAALDLSSAHLLGHSIGGMVAIEHALKRSEQVRSLGLIGTTSSFGGRDESFKQAFLNARLAPLDAGQTMADIAAKAAQDLVGPMAGKACIAAIEASMAAMSEATWRNVLACLVTFDRRDDLANITLPACLIAGSEDRNAPARTMEKMAGKMHDADYHEIAGVGHMINQEAPEQVNAILGAFYRRLSS